MSVARRRQKDIDGAVAALGTSGNIVGVAGDVRDLDAVELALDSANSQLGTIDVLVSAAAGKLGRRQRAVIERLPGALWTSA